MDKLQMAHEWFMKHAGGSKHHLSLEVSLAWEYADAMQAELEERKPKGLPKALSPEVTHINNQLAVQKMMCDDKFQFTGYEP